ncbi:MAG: LysR family transcriptional regulator [Deltaproteobacteria bacterium]|nr:LysR family transcriptional regulator [Deltaproteobacteria bacterium]
MEIRRLEVFCKVVDLKSFTKAAEASYLSQPTVSEHIRILEETFEGKLLERHGRTVRPTAVGKVLYDYARRIIQLKDDTFQAIETFKGEVSGQLVIGSGNIPGIYMLPSIIASFKNRYPSVKLTLKISDSTDILTKLMENQIEMAILGADFPDNRLELKHVFSDEFVLVVPPDHKWAKKKSINLKDVLSEPLILRERGAGSRLTLAKKLESLGLDFKTLNIVAELGSVEAIKQGIKAGIGISIMSSMICRDEACQKKLLCIPFEGDGFKRDISLAKRKHHVFSPVADEFYRHLQMEMEKFQHAKKCS